MTEAHSTMMQDSLSGLRLAWYTLVKMVVTFPIVVWAAAPTVTVKVTVMTPTCVINEDRPIQVEFGEVMTTRIGDDNYKMPINYTLSCTGSTSNALKLQVKGTGATFDSTVLKTNNSSLGLELRQGDEKLVINSWLNFNRSNPPVLWAVPVKQTGAILTGGEFSASATMAVDYQ